MTGFRHSCSMFCLLLRAHELSAHFLTVCSSCLVCFCQAPDLWSASVDMFDVTHGLSWFSLATCSHLYVLSEHVPFVMFVSMCHVLPYLSWLYSSCSRPSFRPPLLSCYPPDVLPYLFSLRSLPCARMTSNVSVWCSPLCPSCLCPPLPHFPRLILHINTKLCSFFSQL